PDSLPVYPTHGAGSMCSAPSRSERATTIGAERATNPLLAAPTEDVFVERLLAGLGSYPPYFTRLREVNRCGPLVYGRRIPDLERLGLHRARHLVDEGAVMVDVRPITSFAAGHIPGALSIPLRQQFATWLGWLVEAETPIVFILDPDQDRTDVVRHAHQIGYE